jgi:hypothetical protein
MPESLKFQYHDGGGKAAGFTGNTGDCVVRAVTIATGKPYAEVYEELNALIDSKRQTKRLRGSSARTGIPKKIVREYLAGRGWQWHSVMGIGKGCTMHLRASELPPGARDCQNQPTHRGGDRRRALRHSQLFPGRHTLRIRLLDPNINH